MAELKHVGRHVANKKRCVVAYRVIPHAAEYCLVVNSDSLDAEQHDSLMKLVESATGQSEYELAEAMQRTSLPDGRNMLQTFHTQGKLVKVSTKDIEMIPNQQTSINLAELNKMIAEQRGITVEDLSIGIKNQKEKEEYLEKNPEVAKEVEKQDDPAAAYNQELLTDEKLAAQYRTQAEALYKEAKDLISQADELDPPAKAPAKAPAKSPAKSTAKSTTAKSTAKSTTNTNKAASTKNKNET